MNGIKVLDIDLSKPIESVEGLDGYRAVRVFAKLHGSPIGSVDVPVKRRCCRSSTILNAILRRHHWPLLIAILRNAVASSSFDNPIKAGLEGMSRRQAQKGLSVTVAVCTRDRPEGLQKCLQSLEKLTYSSLEVMVIDNAPATSVTRELVVSRFPNVRYVCEPRSGLDWARNRAILEARGEIIAFTDDDVVVDREWIEPMVEVFAENPRVAAVTGLVVPYELETEAQILFEAAGGFGNHQGFDQIWYRVEAGSRMPWRLISKPGLFGTGANMAFRREAFDQVGYFDPALDVGTVTNGAGDLEMFYRVLKAGRALVYEPRAIVRHKHRRTYKELRKQRRDNGSVYAYVMATILKYPDERFRGLLLLLWWLWSWHARNFFLAIFGRGGLPLDLVSAEFLGCIRGLSTYPRATRAAKKITVKYGDQAPGMKYKPLVSLREHNAPNSPFAIRCVDLCNQLEKLDGLEAYEGVIVYVAQRGRPVGKVQIPNPCAVVSVDRLSACIAGSLNLDLIENQQSIGRELVWSHAVSLVDRTLRKNLDHVNEVAVDKMPDDIPVSIIVATYDRPANLERCLRSLTNQKTNRDVEVIVVDNNPEKGSATSVVSKFKGITRIEESRQGVAYARNRGIAASSGDIILITDDDVEVPRDWLESILAPFEDQAVMAVTGNSLPASLDTPAQLLFERYGDGGLSRGYARIEANPAWFWSFRFHAVPVWLLGGTANAAFRVGIFEDPSIGLLKETLGPGMPSGIGEDMLCLYKILRTGHTIVYEPRAYVWHEHRRNMSALRRQIFAYSKGIVAYHLTTFLLYRDFRALTALFVGLPSWHVKKILRRIFLRAEYPINLIAVEVIGNLLGPFALLRSYIRVKRLGRSSLHDGHEREAQLRSARQRPSAF